MAKVLNTLKTEILRGEKIEVMRQFFECNKNLTKEEKVNTLSDAVMEYDVPKVKQLLEYMVGIPETSMGDLLEIMKQSQSSLKKENKPCPKTNAIIWLLEQAIKNGEKEKQKALHAEENRAKPCNSNGNGVSTDQIATPNSGIEGLYESINKTITLAIRYGSEVTSLEDLQNRLRRKAKFKEIDFQSKFEGGHSLGDLLLKHAAEKDNSRVKDFFLNNGFTLPQQEQITAAANEEEEQKTPSVKENKPVPPIPTKKTDTGSTAGLSSNNEAGDFTNDQFFPPNEKETKYKKSKENFHTSLRNNVIGVVITASFIAAAVMVPSIAGAAVCGIVAALALVVTGIRVKDSTLPSYKEMREVELTKQNHIPVYNA